MDSKTGCCGWSAGTAKGTSRNGFKDIMVLKDSSLLAPIKTFHVFLKIYYAKNLSLSLYIKHIECIRGKSPCIREGVHTIAIREVAVTTKIPRHL